VRIVVTSASSACQRADPARADDALVAVYGTDFGSTSHVDLQVHRHDASGGGYPLSESARRRLGARALPAGGQASASVSRTP